MESGTYKMVLGKKRLKKEIDNIKFQTRLNR